MRPARAAPPASTGEPVRIALEEDAAVDSAVEQVIAELVGGGLEVLRPPLERAIGRPPAARLVLLLPIATDADVRTAVQAALRGFSLLLVGRADRSTLDRLYDDLRRFGRLDVRSRAAPATPSLDADERSLLAELAAGRTLGEAARALHLSRRTADRRLASARLALGVGTTIEAVARFRAGGPA